MNQRVYNNVNVVSIVLIAVLFFMLCITSSHTLSSILVILMFLVFVFRKILSRFSERNNRKYSIVESRQYGDRIIRIKGLDDEQCMGFLGKHMPVYDEMEEYAGWKPQVKVDDGIIYFLYPSVVSFSDLCIIYAYVIGYDIESERESIEMTGWYPMVEGHSEKQEIPFSNKTLILFRTEYCDHEDFVHFVTEYNHVYRMELSTEKLEEVKDVQANYEPMPDWNTLASEI